jgi:hypothetical protein
MKIKKKNPAKSTKTTKPKAKAKVVKAARPVAIRIVADILADNEQPKNRLSDEKLIPLIKKAVEKAGLKFRPYFAKLSILRRQYNEGRFKQEGRPWGTPPKIKSVRYGDDKKPSNSRTKIAWNLVGGDPYHRPSVKYIKELQALAALARKAGLALKPAKSAKPVKTAKVEPAKPADIKSKSRLKLKKKPKVKSENPKTAPAKTADAAPAKLSGKLCLPKRKAKKVGGPVAPDAAGKKLDDSAVGGNLPPVETADNRPTDDTALSGVGAGNPAGDAETAA